MISVLYPLHLPFFCLIMEDNLYIDYTKPIIDISYEKIRILELNEVTEETKALIITGNPIEDFSFLRFFPNM